MMVTVVSVVNGTNLRYIWFVSLSFNGFILQGLCMVVPVPESMGPWICKSDQYTPE